MKNQFGLPRHIPEEVKRAVRQRCGFGCVICGATITEYEHFFPNFANAERHEADRIALLCPNHHSLVTKGIIPKKQVGEASSDPASRKQGFSKAEHPWFTGIPSLKLGGGALVHGTPVPLRVKGHDVISFEPPEEGSCVSRISANLSDAAGSKVLTIEQNEWRVMAGAWDFQSIGNRYIFKDQTGTVMLQLRMQPPNFIAVETLKTSIEGVPVDLSEERMIIGGNTFINNVMSGSAVGIAFG